MQMSMLNKKMIERCWKQLYNLHFYLQLSTSTNVKKIPGHTTIRQTRRELPFSPLGKWCDPTIAFRARMRDSVTTSLDRHPCMFDYIRRKRIPPSTIRSIMCAWLLPLVLGSRFWSNMRYSKGTCAYDVLAHPAGLEFQNGLCMEYERRAHWLLYPLHRSSTYRYNIHSVGGAKSGGITWAVNLRDQLPLRLLTSPWALASTIN